MRLFIYLFIFLFNCLIGEIFAADTIDSHIDWQDLLLKSFNFFVIFGLIFFFFGKKILLALKNVAQLEYDEFVFLDKKQEKLEEQLTLLQSDIAKEQEKFIEDEKKFYHTIDLEKNNLQQEAIQYSEKLEKNNTIILKQEFILAKKNLCKKIFTLALKKIRKFYL